MGGAQGETARQLRPPCPRSQPPPGACLAGPGAFRADGDGPRGAPSSPGGSLRGTRPCWASESGERTPRKKALTRTPETARARAPRADQDPVRPAPPDGGSPALCPGCGVNPHGQTFRKILGLRAWRALSVRRPFPPSNSLSSTLVTKALGGPRLSASRCHSSVLRRGATSCSSGPGRCQRTRLPPPWPPPWPPP